MGRSVTFLDTLQSLQSYTRTFTESYAVSIVDLRIMNTLEAKTSTTFFTVNSGVTHIRQINVEEKIIKHQGAHSFFEARLGCSG